MATKPVSIRITWKSNQYAGYRGFVNGLELFAISYKPIRMAKDYVVSSFIIPVRRDSDFDKLEEAQAYCEQALEAFVEQLGARFPKEDNSE